MFKSIVLVVKKKKKSEYSLHCICMPYVCVMFIAEIWILGLVVGGGSQPPTLYGQLTVSVSLFDHSLRGLMVNW